MLANLERRSGQVFARFVLPLVLFLAVVGGIAWVTQYMPVRVKSKGDPGTNKEDVTHAAPLLQFEHRIDSHRAAAVWDAKDPMYVKEFERDVDGHYDYPFRNISDQPLQMGLQFSNCDCSRVELSVFTPDEWKQYQAEGAAKIKPTWMALDRNDTKGVAVPKGAHGVARVSWKTKKQEGQPLQLVFKLWTHPQNQADQRQSFDAMTPIQIVAPMMFQPEELRMGIVTGEGTGSILCWSVTRASPKFTVDDGQLSPCYSCTIEPLAETERAALQKKWKEDEKNPRSARIKSAYRLHVTVREEKSGKYLDQGHFRQPIPLVLDGATIPGPLVAGVVRGDLLVGSPDDDGKVQLKSFPATLGIRRVVAISADPATDLKIDASSPAFLKVKLERNKKDSNDARAVWNLSVEVPASSIFGPFPEDAVIILRSQGAQTRLIRIPVHGNAVQG